MGTIGGVLPFVYNTRHHTCFPCPPCKPNNSLPPSNYKISAATSRGLGFLDPEIVDSSRTPQSFLTRKTYTSPSSGHRQIPDIGKDVCEFVGYLSRGIAKANVTVWECRQAHGCLLKLDALRVDGSLGDMLVKAYLKNNDSLDDARSLFDEIPDRGIPAYAALIGSYSKSQRWADLFLVFQWMIDTGFFPDRYLLPTIIKAVSAARLTLSGKMIQGYAIRRGLFDDVVVGNALIDMYASSCDLRYAKGVFDAMGRRDVVSWTALVAVHLNCGNLQDGMEMFRSMQLYGLKADVIAWNSLISGLARGGEIDLALQCLAEMEEEPEVTPDASTWNAIISGCVQNELHECALESFSEMLWTKEIPNAVTIASVLSACSHLEDLDFGMAVHSCALKHDLCGSIHVVGSLIDLYSKCGCCDSAERVFDRAYRRNTIIWNEMISAYANEGKLSAAMDLFDKLKNSSVVKPDGITYNILLSPHAKHGKRSESYSLLHEMTQVGLEPNIVTFNSLISGFEQSGLNYEALYLFKAMLSPSSDAFPDLTRKPVQPNHVTVSAVVAACADLELGCKGREIHGYVLRNSLDSNIFVSSALVDMYAKCRDINIAEKVFCTIKNKNTVCWNALMAGYATNRKPKDALLLFNRMLEEENEPSLVTFMILMQACGEVGALTLGTVLHGYMIKKHIYASDNKLTSVLIEMYAKCSSIMEANLVFESGTCRDVAVWNSMMSSFSAHGMTKNTIVLFEQMQVAEIMPDDVTFVALLSACARDGLAEEGWAYFHKMQRTYGIVPSLKHYTCMVAIMAAVGLLDEALEFIRAMPYEPDACCWATLLGACRAHSNPEIGERAARALFELEPRNATNYILLSNIYSSAGLWDSARSLRDFIERNEISFLRECSSIDVGGKVYGFNGSTDYPPMTEGIFELWEKLVNEMKLLGHSPLNPVLGEDEELDPLLCLHTEKLAICTGIISLSATQPIRVFKNLRMCIDCHMSAKLITKITRREIFVKDVGYYHHMKDGVCSCHDRW